MSTAAVAHQGPDLGTSSNQEQRSDRPGRELGGGAQTHTQRRHLLGQELIIFVRVRYFSM